MYNPTLCVIHMAALIAGHSPTIATREICRTLPVPRSMRVEIRDLLRAGADIHELVLHLVEHRYLTEADADEAAALRATTNR